jgi:hypothetical protein
MQIKDLEGFGTIEMVVIGIHGKFAKIFILVEANDTRVLNLFLEFYAKHV